MLTTARLFNQNNIYWVKLYNINVCVKLLNNVLYFKLISERGKRWQSSSKRLVSNRNLRLVFEAEKEHK